MTEEEELQAAILASQLEEERQWDGMGKALHDSWMVAQAAAPAPPPAVLPPPPPTTASVWPPPQVFIEIEDDDDE